MAIYHIHIQAISRGSGKSCVASAAYRSGEKLNDDRQGLTHDYTSKGGIVHTEIILPKHAPNEFQNREGLWNAVDRAEDKFNRKKATALTAKEFEISLPRELTREQSLQALRGYIKENFTDKGLCADFAIHDKKDGNPHAHVMVTAREINAEGNFDKKRSTAIDGNWKERNAQMQQWRESWAKYCNKELEKAASKERIDHRSYEIRGVEKIPTVHQGKDVTHLEKRKGEKTRVGDINRNIQAKNKEIEELKKLEQKYNFELQKAQVLMKNWERAEQENKIEPVHDQQALKIQAQQEAQRLIALKNQYIQLEKSKEELLRIREHEEAKIRAAEHKYEDLSARKSELAHRENEITKLRAKEKSLGLLQGKERKFLKQQIKDYEYRQQQAISDLQKIYGIRPEQIDEERTLRKDLIVTYHQKDRVNTIKVIENNQKEIELEYKLIKAQSQLKDEQYRNLVKTYSSEIPDKDQSDGIKDKSISARARSRLENLSAKDIKDLDTKFTDKEKEALRAIIKTRSGNQQERDIEEREMPPLNLNVDWAQINYLESKNNSRYQGRTRER